MGDLSGVCGECGASVYKQHIDSGIARSEGGKLLCSHCLVEYEKAHKQEAVAAFEPIELEGSDTQSSAPDSSSSRIHSATATSLGVGKAWDDSGFKRPLDTRAISATRCRSFHSKLTANALQFMNKQINDWLDENEQITVKFATSTMGVFEGKHAEPNLILTIFY